MSYDMSLAQRLRDAGLRVVEVAGWQTRGDDSFNPRGSVNHHTADGPSGSAPSLDGIVNGFSGSAPPPLANAMQSREPDGNDIIYVVAAGRANHAGEGGWKGLSGNSSVYGLEVEHTGTDPLPEGRQRIAAQFHAALAQGRYGADMVCQHKEWAPDRKIDAATNVDPNTFRGYVAQYLSGDVGDKVTSEEDMRACSDDDGGIYVFGPGLFEHVNGEQWGAWERFTGPALRVNNRQRDLLRETCMAQGATTWNELLKSRIDGQPYAAGDILTSAEQAARAASGDDKAERSVEDEAAKKKEARRRWRP